MQAEAVIFDLDGTLLDTLADIANAANDVLAEFQLPQHSIPDYRFMVGDGVSVLFNRALPKEKLSPELLEQCVIAFQKHYALRWNQSSRPYDGIPSMLNSLIDSGLKLAILSNKPQAFTEKCTSEFLSDWKFDDVLGASDARPRKPDPAGVFYILERWNLSADRCFYLGDTNTDMQTAVSSGCLPVGVTWGFRKEQELRDSGAKWIIHHPSEFLDLVRSQAESK